MAISLVQSNKALTNSSVTSQNVTWLSNTTNGNLIVVASGSVATSNRITSISDSQSNTYTRAIQQANGSTAFVEIWYALNIAGGTTPTVTVNYGGIGVHPVVSIREYSGLATSAALDQTLGANVPNSTTTWSVGPTSSTQGNNEVVIVAAVANDNSHTWTLGTGYGNLQTQVAASTGNQATEDQIVSSTGTQTGTLTASALMGGGSMAIATFSGTPISGVSDDNVTTSDTSTVTDGPRGYSDTIATRDQVNVVIVGGSSDLNINTSDTTGVTDSLSLLIPVLFVTTSDTSAVTDSAITSIPGVTPYQVNVNDPVGVTDAIQLSIVTSINVSDTTTISESVVAAPIISVSSADYVQVNETFGSPWLSFNGLADKLQNLAITGLATTSNDITIAFWSRLGKDGLPVANSQNAIQYLFWRMHDRNATNSQQWRVDDAGAARVAGDSALGSGDVSWHHWAGTYTVTGGTNYTLKLYRDGVLKTTVPVSVGTLPTTNYQSNGVSIAQGNGNFLGSMRDVRIYHALAADSDITALFNSGTDFTTPKLSWPMNEGTGSTITDASGNGFPGTLTGGTWVTSSHITLDDLHVSVTDATAIAESIQTLEQSQLSIAETTTISENGQRQITSFITTSDSSTITELIQTSGVAKSVSIADTITLNENVVASVPGATMLVNVSDRPSLSESIQTLKVYPSGSSDVVDTMSPESGPIQVGNSDSLETVDTRTGSIQVGNSDSLETVDTRTGSIQAGNSDSVETVDTRTGPIAVGQSDSVETVDIRTGSIQASGSDSLDTM